MDQLFAVVYQFHLPCFYVGVQAFFYDGQCGVFVNLGTAQVNALEVAAGTGEVKPVGVSLPYPEAELVRHSTFFHRFVHQAQGLILESGRLYVFPCFVFHVEQHQGFLRDVFFTRHFVFVPFQFGPRLCQYIDHKQVFYFGSIGALKDKMAGVGAP